MKRTTRTLTFLVASLVLGAMFTTSATAQSDNELRRENQRLQTRVAELDNELAAAKARIQKLEEMIREIQAGGAPGGNRPPTEAPEEEKVSIDETKREASPRALLAALSEAYKEAFAAQDAGAEDSSERGTFLRNANRWATRMSREFRMPVEWHVQITEVIQATRTGFGVKMQAVDPVHGTKLGDPFPAEIPKNRTRVIEEGGRNATYIIKGSLTPLIGVNPERATPGTFNTPKLIGPYAELGFRVNVTNIVAADPTAPRRPGTRGPSSRPGSRDGG